MQKISVDLIRPAVSGAAVCTVVVAANLAGLHHRDRLADAGIRIPPPIRVQAISIAAPATCWATNKPIGASAMQETQSERRTILQSCASVAPPLRRNSEPQSLLALAP